jgi:hypothetical protein
MDPLRLQIVLAGDGAPTPRIGVTINGLPNHIVDRPIGGRVWCGISVLFHVATGKHHAARGRHSPSHHSEHARARAFPQRVAAALPSCHQACEAVASTSSPGPT